MLFRNLEPQSQQDQADSISKFNLPIAEYLKKIKFWDCVQDFLREALFLKSSFFSGMEGNVLNEFFDFEFFQLHKYDLQFFLCRVNNDCYINKKDPKH